MYTFFICNRITFYPVFYRSTFGASLNRIYIYPASACLKFRMNLLCCGLILMTAHSPLYTITGNLSYYLITFCDKLRIHTLKHFLIFPRICINFSDFYILNLLFLISICLDSFRHYISQHRHCP